MKRRKRGRGFEDNGFAEWGGYMEAKKTKLQDQFKIEAAREPFADSTQIFDGVAIFVNGYSVPSADELKLLMMKHGGVYHHYFRNGKTTHIIATNLPDTKVKQLKHMNVVKPDWIVESIAAGRLLDFRQYLLYSHQSKTQPKLMFKPISEPSTSSISNATVIHGDFDQDSDTSSTTDTVGFTNKSVEESGHIDLIKNSSPFDQKNKESGSLIKPVTESKDSLTTLKTGIHSIKTASEAGFLTEFYNNSRLHHISTMGASFKQYVNSLREKCTGIFPGMERLKTLQQNQSANVVQQCGVVRKYEKVVMHIDMDCFFVSVGLRNRPELKGFPVAVTHAKASAETSSSHRTGVDRKAEFDLYKTRREEKVKGKYQQDGLNKDVKPWSDWVEAVSENDSMSEIASCNYEARKYGLKNGMFLGQALKLCPTLKTIPYDFNGYKEVAYCLYDTIASYTVDIEAVSCDEMFVDCTSLLNVTGTSPQQLATLLRTEIKDKTGCPCSTGFGSNRLQARLATKRAKPDGQYYLEPADVQTFMSDIKVSDLPGVGRSTSYKLSTMGLQTCLDLQQVPLSKLQAEFGVKSGEALYKHCRGEDTKKLVFGQVRKSVSAEVNYGIRFQNQSEADTFLEELSREVHNRLQEVNMKTRVVTLKLMIKAKDAPAESAKFLGHGVCDQISKSSPLQIATSDLDSIVREVKSLSRQLNVDPTELRGIGIQLTRLESEKSVRPSANALDKFLRPKTDLIMDAKKERQMPVTDSQGKEENVSSSSAIDQFFTAKKNVPNRTRVKLKNPIRPAEIDKGVLEALPEDIRQEIMQEYGMEAEVLHEDNKKEGNKPIQYDCGVNISQIDLDVLEELPLEIKKEIQSSMNTNKRSTRKRVENDLAVRVDTGPKLDENLPPSEVRALIKAWTFSEDSPQACDVNMLTDYLQGLVSSRRLDSLDVCISCLHRCIEKRHSKVWQEVYHLVITSVQQIMMAVYGLRLRVPCTFSD